MLSSNAGKGKERERETDVSCRVERTNPGEERRGRCIGALRAGARMRSTVAFSSISTNTIIFIYLPAGDDAVE